jgi:hypothetical protein
MDNRSVLRGASTIKDRPNTSLAFGIGTEASPLVSNKVGIFMDFRFKSVAAAGSTPRGMYLGLYNYGNLLTAPEDGEALRVRHVLGAVAAGGIHGAHIGLSFLTTSSIAKCTGLGVALRATFEVPNRSILSGGTYYALQAEMYCVGSSSSMAACTKHAVLGIGANGDATGGATVKNAIAFDGPDATGNMVYTHSITVGATAAGSVRILANGTVGYMYWYAAQGS